MMYFPKFTRSHDSDHIRYLSKVIYHARTYYSSVSISTRQAFAVPVVLLTENVLVPRDTSDLI